MTGVRRQCDPLNTKRKDKKDQIEIEIEVVRKMMDNFQHVICKMMEVFLLFALALFSSKRSLFGWTNH